MFLKDKKGIDGQNGVFTCVQSSQWITSTVCLSADRGFYIIISCLVSYSVNYGYFEV